MKLVSVDKLIPGMVVSENVYTLDDRLVAPKDTILTQKDIDRIRSYSLYNIFVEEQMKGTCFKRREGSRCFDAFICAKTKEH